MNLLLRTLSSSDRRVLDPYLVSTPMSSGEPVATAGAPIHTLLFPESGTINLSTPRQCANNFAIALVGREGMIGWSTLLGYRDAPFEATVGPTDGSAHAIDILPFTAACASSATLRATVLSFAQVMAEQLASSAACAIQDSFGRRLARWLLMLHDRQDSDELEVTHDALAGELGTRRASVTDCLHLLEGDHIVRCARGRIIVRDRGALERAAGAAYGRAETCYRALIGPFGQSAEAMRPMTRAA